MLQIRENRGLSIYTNTDEEGSYHTYHITRGDISHSLHNYFTTDEKSDGESPMLGGKRGLLVGGIFISLVTRRAMP